MLYREIIAVCSQIHTKHINTLCGQNVEFVNFKAIYIYEYNTYIYNNHHVLKGVCVEAFRASPEWQSTIG